MAEYIVAMDPSTHADASAAQTAITSTGATISKTYSFSLTYKIEAEDAQRDAINGVLHIEDYGREAVITPTFNTNHLKQFKKIYLHPFVNDRTICLNVNDLEKFLNKYDISINWENL